MAISSPEMMLVPYFSMSARISLSLSGCWLLTEVDVTEASAANLASDTVLVPHTEILHAPRQHVFQVSTVRTNQM